MSAPLRTALVGCGKIGRTHALALTRLPESQFVGCCDADAGRAAAFAAEFGGSAHATVDDLLRSADPEVLLIATPHPLHAAPAVAALEAGVHVLVEKPLAATLEDCDAMLAAADRGGATLGVVSQRRYYKPVVRMRRAIDAGKIGRPVLGLFLMYSWRDPAYYRSDPWRGRWATKDGAGEGGGVLVNQSPHQLDLLQWFLGEPEEVTGYWANLNHPTVEVEDSAVAALRFRGGGLGAILSSLSQDPGIYTKVHVHGSNGASVGVQTDTGASFVAGVSGIADPPLNDVWTIPGEQGELESFRQQDAAAFAAVDGTTHYHKLNIADFLRAVRDGSPPPVTGAEGRTVVAMFQAIYESNRTGRSVRLRYSLSSSHRRLPMSSPPVLIVVGDASETMDTLYPYHRLIEAGYEPVVAAPERRTYQMVLHEVREGWTITKEWEGYRINADVTFAEVDPERYLGVFYSGGRAPEYLRDDPDLIRLTRAFFAANKPILSVCHGVEIPARAGCVEGRRMATVAKCRFDLEVCGGVYVDEPSVVDGNLCSGRTYHDSGHYVRPWIELLDAARDAA